MVFFLLALGSAWGCVCFPACFSTIFFPQVCMSLLYLCLLPVEHLKHVGCLFLILSAAPKTNFAKVWISALHSEIFVGLLLCFVAHGESSIVPCPLSYLPMPAPRCMASCAPARECPATWCCAVPLRRLLTPDHRCFIPRRISSC